MQLGSPNLTDKCFTMSLGLPLILGSKGQGHESQKHCRSGSLYSCECWLFLIVSVMAAGSVPSDCGRCWELLSSLTFRTTRQLCWLQTLLPWSARTQKVCACLSFDYYKSLKHNVIYLFPTFNFCLTNLLLRAGGKKRFFWNRLWTLTEHISPTEHDINNRKETFQFTGTPLHAPKIWWTSVQKRLRTVGELFAHPLEFSHCETLPALPQGLYVTDSRLTLTRVM